MLEDETGHYISLLTFRPEEAVEQVRALLGECSNPEQEVCGLLDQLDWRFHTIAITAIVLGVRTTKVIDSIWAAADCGSWAIPQLIATAYLFDPEFAARTTDRFSTGFVIDPARMLGLDRYEIGSQAGPVGLNLKHVSAKAMAALVYCCNQLPELSEELRELLDSDGVQNLVKQDEENGAQIAARFLETVRSSESLPGPAAVR